jgi:ornithine--oxo-acid transaminase
VFFYGTLTVKRYYDFLSGYSAVNQGHCHPRIIDKLVRAGTKTTLLQEHFTAIILASMHNTSPAIFGLR